MTDVLGWFEESEEDTYRLRYVEDGEVHVVESVPANDVEARDSVVNQPPMAQLLAVDLTIEGPLTVVQWSDPARGGVSRATNVTTSRLSLRSGRIQTDIGELMRASLEVLHPAPDEVEFNALVNSLPSRIRTGQFEAWLVDGAIVLHHAQGLSAGLRNVAIQRRKRLDDEFKALVARHGFAMPYNFVPIPAGKVVESQRNVPAGHLAQSDTLLTGSLTFTATSVTPLALADLESEIGEVRTSRPLFRNGHVEVWGSGLKGALRATFEQLTGSCLRVLETDLSRISYRDPAMSRTSDWSLGVVSDVDDDGVPLSVRECPTRIWVPIADATRVPSLTTGNIVTIVGGTPTPVQGRTIHRGGTLSRVAGGAPRVGKQYVALVTAIAGRNAKYWVFGEVPASGSPIMPLVGEAGLRYRIEVEATEDTRTAPSSTGPVDVGRGGAQRLPAVLGALKKGAPIWFQSEGADVTRIALSHIWRTHPEEPVASLADRLGTTEESRGSCACKDVKHLCPACRVFGSVDADSDRKSDSAEQHSYRGQVRPIVMRSINPVELTESPEDLPPMGTPRPGSAQNYFRLSEEQERASGSERPLRELGGRADREPERSKSERPKSEKPKPARPNGRKRWWMTSKLPSERQRWSTLDSGTDEHHEMDSKAFTIAEGTPFRAELTFVNLTQAELGALIATVDIRRVAERHLGTTDARYGWHLGRGKGIGLGVMETTEVAVTTWTSQTRYLDQEPARTWSTSDKSQCVADFVDSVPAEVKKVSWPALFTLCTIDHLNGEWVTYPMIWGDDKKIVRPESTDAYLAGTLNPAYSTWTSGSTDQNRKLVLLPLAEDPKQYQRFDGQGAVERRHQ